MVKRSFYEMLGVPHDATKEQIDAAYHDLSDKLSKTTNLRGTSEAMTELTMIRDGYRILSDPQKRKMYDAKILAAETGVQLMFFPEGGTATKKLGLEAVIFAALVSTLGYIVYQQMNKQMDEVRLTYSQAVIKKKEDQAKAISLDPTQAQANPSDVHVVAEPEKKK